MSDVTALPRDLATVVFNLPGYRVIDAVEDCDGREVVVESLEVPGCPDCGVIASRIHSRTRQRLRDIGVGGPVRLIWWKRRWFCSEVLCARKTFTESTIQVPRFARSTGRLKTAVVDAVAESKRAVSDVASGYKVSWWFVQANLDQAVLVLPEVDHEPVPHLGVDEHRYRSVRFFREPDGTWQRYEPWMSTLVDADTGRVLGVADGRSSAGIADWLQARRPAWLAGVEVVAIDPSAAFRKALRDHLPDARVSVDKFHLVQKANEAVTQVRQRVARETLGHRGRKTDLVWAHRQLLLRAGETLSGRALARLQHVFDHDDPTGQIAAAWAVKERVRQVLNSPSVEEAREARMRLGCDVIGADMAETTKLWNTICAWWTEIETMIETGVTNARTEAANTGIKHIKRTGRGFRNPANYKTRILLTSAARRAA